MKLINIIKEVLYKKKEPIEIKSNDVYAKYGIDTLKGANISLLKKNFPWIFESKIRNANIEIVRGIELIWKGGTWYKGTWEDGIWENGTWEDGTWEDGIWENGTWKNGTWNNGIWENGNWYNGTWKNGKWENGRWKRGFIYDPVKDRVTFVDRQKNAIELIQKNYREK